MAGFGISTVKMVILHYWLVSLKFLSAISICPGPLQYLHSSYHISVTRVLITENVLQQPQIIAVQICKAQKEVFKAKW